MKLLLICGSLRQGSYNKSITRAIEQLCPQHTFTHADIGSLPLMNQDLEADFPASAATLKQQISDADGVIICSPEYNYSVPGVVKNAIDWASRPYGQSAWGKKPVAVLGATNGGFGTIRMQPQLKLMLTLVNARVMTMPEIFISHVADKLDEQGALTDESTQKQLTDFVAAFSDWITQLQK